MGYRTRFRKSFPIIPKLFYINFTKTGISWTLRFGPFSRTWGRGRETTTIDAPGAFGFSWRKTNTGE